MNGDLTRDSFDPRDGYTAVRAQQGRVMLDADHNEQADILLGDTRMGRRDLVGAAAAPADAPGFGVTLAAGVPQLGAGRYLLDGLRLENAAALSLAGPQPFLPASVLPTTAGEWLAYLEAWERSLTAVEEPSIREVALGGPDTTTRDQLVWQVRWLRLGNAGGGSTCAAAATRPSTPPRGPSRPRSPPASMWASSTRPAGRSRPSCAWRCGLGTTTPPRRRRTCPPGTARRPRCRTRARNRVAPQRPRRSARRRPGSRPPPCACVPRPPACQSPRAQPGQQATGPTGRT
jgi:hypothetical protein